MFDGSPSLPNLHGVDHDSCGHHRRARPDSWARHLARHWKWWFSIFWSLKTIKCLVLSIKNCHFANHGDEINSKYQQTANTWNINYPKGDIYNGILSLNQGLWNNLEWLEDPQEPSSTLRHHFAFQVYFVPCFSSNPTNIADICGPGLVSHKMLRSTRLPRPLLNTLTAPARHERTSGAMIARNIL